MLLMIVARRCTNEQYTRIRNIDKKVRQKLKQPSHDGNKFVFQEGATATINNQPK